MKKSVNKTNVTPITFTSAKTVVTADRYVPYALYAQNKAIVEQLGGEIIKGVGEFRAKFAKVADAKAFVAQAVTHMSTKEYNAARKTEPKASVQKVATNGKGTNKRVSAVEYVTLTDSDGLTYQVPKSALTSVGTKAKTKGKGEAKPTPANTKAKKVAEPKAPARKAKGNGFDFTTIKGADNRAKNKALHQALVKMGIPDSRTPEYMAVWNARPWAK